MVVSDELAKRLPAEPASRGVRRIAPLAAAIGVIVAASIGLVLARINVPASGQTTVPAISTPAPTTR